jgi:hypothetical protein
MIAARKLAVTHDPEEQAQSADHVVSKLAGMEHADTLEKRD